MAIDLPLAEYAKNPDKHIPELEKMQGEARDRLRGLSVALKELRKIQASTDHLEYIQIHGIPRPREGVRDDMATDGTCPDGDADDDEGPTPSRREQVLRLLSQVPGREWKVRDIAAALGIENIKSLRTSMDEFARTGAVRKNVDRSTYFLSPQGFQESF
jgi:hypothetical protein